MGETDPAPEARLRPEGPTVEASLQAESRAVQAESRAVEGVYVAVSGRADCRHVWSAVGAEPCNLSIPGDGDCTIYRFVKCCYLCGRRLEY